MRMKGWAEEKRVDPVGEVEKAPAYTPVSWSCFGHPCSVLVPLLSLIASEELRGVSVICGLHRGY